MRITHGELEAYVVEKAGEIARDMVQSNLDLRGLAEQRVRVVGSDRVKRSESRPATRKLRPLVGNAVVPRLLYQAAGAEGLAPQDQALSLAQDSFSMGVRRQTGPGPCPGLPASVIDCHTRKSPTSGGSSQPPTSSARSRRTASFQPHGPTLRQSFPRSRVQSQQDDRQPRQFLLIDGAGAVGGKAMSYRESPMIDVTGVIRTIPVSSSASRREGFHLRLRY